MVFKYGGDAVEAGAVRRMASGQIQFLNDGKVFDVDVADFGKDKFYVVIVAKIKFDFGLLAADRVVLSV